MNDIAEEKTKAETAKLEAEKQKIVEEIKNLKAASWPERTTKLAGFLVALAAVIGILVDGYKYLGEQEADREFQINKDLMDLTRELTDRNPLQQRNAALMLGALHWSTATVLAEQLAYGHDSEVQVSNREHR